MPDKHLYEYAVIRVVPRVEREEFINVGVVLFCKQQKYLKALFSLNADKLKSISPESDVATIQPYLDAFVAISNGKSPCGPIGQLDPASRFRWLTATRSSIIQTSKVHPGFSNDLDKTLERLHEQLVM
ncbi:DUF3037 domain-containing protein [Chitinophaga silvatica]|uniref:DUF3037 domain-containing protein n=1 Tax=Chitinophaga silvatica TaxID=2282649 RepID=A0A3E1Y718_9BACT|nr:DUF3037 domain-containing protein [Chitinophaga silvatica]RFS20756.1 DUF3037 domain-containing protein [Chitinophaga silvatica]